MREERGGEWSEKRGKRREERREEGGGRRKEGGEKRGKRMTPDISFLIGVARRVLLSLPCTCHVSAFGIADPFMFSKLGAHCDE